MCQHFSGMKTSLFHPLYLIMVNYDFRKKSDLLNLMPEDSQPEPPNVFDVSVIDGAALVHLLPTSIATFDEYADLVFIPHLVRQLEKCSRLDLVWDTYITDSIKASTRER